MMYSLEDSVLAVEQYLPHTLVPPNAIAAIAALTRHLPDALSYHFRFGCPLGPGSDRPRFVMKVDPSSGSAILAGSHPAIRLSDALRGQAAWARVQDFCAQWVDPASPHSHLLEAIWVEFDAEYQSNGAAPDKLFFFPQAGANSAVDEWVIEKALPLLRGAPTPPALGRTMAACLARIGGRAQLLRIALFLAPGIDAVHLGLYPSSKEQLLACLTDLNWTGPIDRVEALVAPLYGLTNEICLNVTAGEDIHAEVGIECHFDGFSRSIAESKWRELLDHLVATSVCVPEKRDAVLAFPGYSIENFIVERVFFRRLHHVEVVYQPGKLPEATAFLGITHRPLSMLQPAAEGT